MPSYFMLTGEYLELGSGAAGNAGRSSANLGKIVYDSNGFLYCLKSNGDAASRAAFAPTVVDQTNTDNRNVVCIQPATARLNHWAGLWAASVVNSTATDGTDLQWVLFRGSASAVPLETGNDHIASNSTGMFQPMAGGDSLSSITANYAVSNFVDTTGGKYAWLVGASITSSVASANAWLSFPAW